MKITQALLTTTIVSDVVIAHPSSAYAKQSYQYAINPTKT